MTAAEAVKALDQYRLVFQAVLERFQRTHSGVHIAHDDDAVVRQQVLELRDCLHDILGPNDYSQQVVTLFNDGITNISGTPSYNSVRNIVGVVAAAVSRIKRQPDILVSTQRVGIPPVSVEGRRRQFAILEILAGVRHQHKFNLLGKGSSPGDLERRLGLQFEAAERHAAAVSFGELEKAGLIAPTYEDLIAPELWFAITDAGRVVLGQGVEGLGRVFAVPLAVQSRELEQKFKILFSAGQALIDFDEYSSIADVGETTAVLFLDIDNFKPLNSAHSETVVDRTILPEVQRLLKSATAQRGNAYRWGGEEFVVILPNHTEPEAVAFAERLRRTVEGHSFPVGDIAVRITLSVGVALFPKDGSTFDEVLRAANAAEHAAKKAGRNCVVVAGSK
jgi:diguanylate cyclase (GGDEF)-like protein